MIALLCRRFRPALVDLAVGTLAPGDARDVEAHVAKCRACRADLAAVRGIAFEFDGPAAAAVPSEDFWRVQRQSIMRRVRNAAEPVRVTPRPTRRWQLAGALATVVLGVVIGARLQHHHMHAIPLATSSSSVEHLDDDALFDLHDLLTTIAPASSIEDADSDMTAINDLPDDEIEALADGWDPGS